MRAMGTLGSTSDTAAAFFEAADGTRVPLAGGRHEVLVEWLRSGDVRALLREHGLEASLEGTALITTPESLIAALERASDAHRTPGRPAPVAADALAAQAAALAHRANTSARLVVTLPRPDLRVVPAKRNPIEALLAMDTVDPDDAEELLATLDAVLDETDLPGEALERALVPLLTVAKTQALAARLLGRARVAKAASPLRSALARAASLEGRVEILAALVRLGRRSLGLRTLRSILAHGDETARRRVVAALWDVAEPGDAAIVHDMLRLLPQEERAELAALVYALGDVRGYPVVAGVMRDLERVDSASAERVLRAIDRVDSRRFAPMLSGYAERESRSWFEARARQISRRLAALGRDEPTPGDLLEQAEESYFGNRNAEATALLDEVVALEPENARALYLYANCLKEDARLPEALRTCNRALAVDPSHWRAQRLRGSLLWDLDRHELALEAYDRALSLNPVDPYTWYYKGYVLYRLRRDSEALPCLDRALSLKNDSPYIHNQKAFCLERLERHDEAAKCYQRSLQLKPNDLTIRDYLGEALQAADRLSEAKAVYESILRDQADRDETLYHLADVLYDLEEWEGSAGAFGQYLERRPDSYNAWFNRGLCLRFLTRHAEAVECFRAALERRPDSVNARKHLHYCEHQLRTDKPR